MDKSVVRNLTWMDFDGAALKNFRRRHDFSQTELADILGVERRSIERWEKSKAPTMAAHALTLLSMFLERQELVGSVKRMLSSADGRRFQSALGIEDISWSRDTAMGREAYEA